MTGKQTDESKRLTHEAPQDMAERERSGDADHRPAVPSCWGCAPLPGLVDHIGAHVGGELAEERWR